MTENVNQPSVNEKPFPMQEEETNDSVDMETRRRQEQLAFDASGEEICFGSLSGIGMTLEQLKETCIESEYVTEAFTNGLTAEVFHIRINDADWNLKIKRPQSLVKNTDGQTSFLNEVQRRWDFRQLRGEPAIIQDPVATAALSHIVDTQFASYRNGIMLSPWLTGAPLDEFNEQILRQIFATIVQIELNGIMEWDYCPSNIIYDGEKIYLFDFGYCWRFDPLQHFNSSGLKAPMFHGIERLESRNFFGYLLKQEKTWSETAIISLFELEKRLAIEACQYKYTELERRGASARVLSWLKDIIDNWQQAMTCGDKLQQLFLKEGYRSHVLDIHDDISGQSCTPVTLERIGKVESILQNHYAMLLANNGLFFGDEHQSKPALLAKLTGQRRLAEKYQL